MGRDWKRWVGGKQRRTRAGVAPRRGRRTPEPAMTFAPVVVTPDASPAQAGLIEIRLGEAVIRVPQQVDAHALALVLAAVRGAS
jgi:hypothetical protein